MVLLLVLQENQIWETQIDIFFQSAKLGVPALGERS